jgi:hypothetical protein
MTASRIIASHRKARRGSNWALLSSEQKKANSVAAHHYVIFGGKKGHGTGGSFEEFARRSPKGGLPVKAPLRRLFSQAAAIAKYFREKLARRREIKRRRKQRPSGFACRQSKAASPI